MSCVMAKVILSSFIIVNEVISITFLKRFAAEGGMVKSVGECQPVKAVLYDMDGTIIDSDPLHVQAWQYTGTQFGFELTAEQLSTAKGLSSKKTLETLLPKDKYDIIPPACEMKFKYLMEHIGEVPILGNFMEAYQQLRERKIPIGVCTSARKEFVDAVLQNVPSLSFLTGKVAWKEMFIEGKPSADPLYVTLAQLEDGKGRIPTSSAIYVGDGFSDYGSAQNAGMPFVYFCADEKKRDTRMPSKLPTIKDHRDIFHLLQAERGKK